MQKNIYTYTHAKKLHLRQPKALITKGREDINTLRSIHHKIMSSWHGGTMMITPLYITIHCIHYTEVHA